MAPVVGGLRSVGSTQPHSAYRVRNDVFLQVLGPSIVTQIGLEKFEDALTR
jgi:hypothetical protein